MPVEEKPNYAHKIAFRAIEIAKSYNHEMATLEHVAVALLETSEIQKCFSDLNINSKNISDLLNQFMVSGFIDTVSDDWKPVQSKLFENLFTRIVANATVAARAFTSVDILLYLTQFPHEDNNAVTILLSENVNSLAIKKYLSHSTQSGTFGSKMHRPGDAYENGGAQAETPPSSREEAIAYVSKYAKNLNESAKEGKIDPIIGRAIELDQTTQIVARRTKNNCIYVGDPGVGKTALAEGLAYNIVNGQSPLLLKNATVWSLDVGSLVAGTRFRGDLEERMNVLLKSLLFLSEPVEGGDPKSPEIGILFIDEIHTIMEAGSGSKGSLDVSNMLKPALARGTLRCIGSTTFEEYRKHFEKDRALARRFKKVQIDEPSPELTKAILRGLRGIYEKYHNVTYTDAALDAAVDLTHRYVHTALLPDKAIDMIDQAGARQRITAETERLSVIDVLQIEAEVAKIVKFPAKELAESDSEKLSRLAEDLESAVFGQPKAIRALTDAVMISKAGLREPNLPAGAYLMAGPTGTGKTFAARQLAKTLNIPLIKFDMSEYMEKHSVSKLIGSPPGYVGFGDGGAGDGLLVNAIEKSPSCVLLLDEIEKAHEDIFNLLLQVMDDAKLTNSQGKTVNFTNVILIMTSNAGVVKTETNAIGFGRSKDESVFDDAAIKKLFKPEFRNRLDAIITFDRLTPDTMLLIVDKFIGNLQTLAASRDITIELDSAAREWLAIKGYDPVFGARPLTRVIDEHIKKPMSREMLFGTLKNGGNAKITVVDDNLVVTGATLS